MKKVVAIAIVLLVVIAAFAFQKKEYDREESPDGAFTAIAEYRAYRAWLPMMPGSGGDRPGSVRLVTKDGVLVGEVSVPMVSIVHDIRWSIEEASIPSVASWRLPSR